MNSALSGAIAELKTAGANGLPSPTTIESANDGTSWKGKKSNGEEWTLTKNNEDSYNCMC